MYNPLYGLTWRSPSSERLRFSLNCQTAVGLSSRDGSLSTFTCELDRTRGLAENRCKRDFLRCMYCLSCSLRYYKRL